jgi:hypothetical protein
MLPTTDMSAQAAAVDFVRRIVPFWQAALGTELLGVYLIGSLAHGGFSRRYSDIDMAVVTEAGLSPQALDRVRSQVAAVSADWAAKLSIFWTDRQFRIGRFPPLDRIDYIDHAVVLMERERVRPVRPRLEEIRNYLGGAPFANWTEQARRFASAEALDPKDHKAYLRTLLYPRGSWQNTPREAGRKLDQPCVALSVRRRRSPLLISCADELAVSGQRLCHTAYWGGSRARDADRALGLPTTGAVHGRKQVWQSLTKKPCFFAPAPPNRIQTFTLT